MHFPIDFPAFAGLRICAQFLGLSYSHIRKITYDQRPAPAGWPAPVRVGGKVGYLRHDLERWLDSLSSAADQVSACPGAPAQQAAETPPPRRRGRPRKLESAARGAKK
ncbi:hypothetical protein [Propionivibrio limicola]|uniref:hypothetical protein n=1 Tax=Propionivibrio limicola TaxID=167645 RepID=UPI00147932C1|nr:hypothetical protein [Propionivibrio limicola]